MNEYTNEMTEPAGTLEREPWRPGFALSWSGIVGGTFIGMGLLLLFLIFGTALGLTILDPYQIARHENSAAWTGGTIAWIVISALAAVFIGAWFAGHIGRVTRESALIEGAVVWGLCAILTSIGLGRSNVFPQRPLRAAESKVLANGYSSLNDPQFSSFVLDRARNWRPGNAEEPVNVSVDAQRRVNPNKIPNNGDLQKYIEANTNLSSKQTEEFLEADKNAIANAQADAQKRWEQKNADELARVDRTRKAASAAAWTLTGIAFASLALAIGGAYMGWYQRDHDLLARGFRRHREPVHTTPPPPPPTTTNA